MFRVLSPIDEMTDDGRTGECAGIRPFVRRLLYRIAIGKKALRLEFVV
jgi:hypothetical protein